MSVNDRRPEGRLVLTRPGSDERQPDVIGGATGSASGGAQTYAECVDIILNARARFSDRFDPALFADPALDMLLALFRATEEGRMMTTNSCCAASRVPRTTALRWIKVLTARRHVIATDDPSDRRSTLLQLAPAACEDIRQWLDECITLAPGTGASTVSAG